MAKDTDEGLKAKHLTRLTKSLGLSCEGYKRFRLPEDVRVLTRKYWPEGRPAYWQPDTYEAEHEITTEIWGRSQLQSDGPNDPPRSWNALNIFTGGGLATRTGGSLVDASRGGIFPPHFTPATDDYIAHRGPADWRQWSSFLAAKDVFLTSDLDYRGGRTRGFAYCGANLRLTAEQKASLGSIDQKPTAYRVDGQDVFSKRPAGNVGDTWIFERDEAAFHNFMFGLDSTRGDV